MKLFVTGAAGFIGSNYVRWLQTNSDDEVTIFDALTYAGSLASIRDVLDDRRFTFVHADICDEDDVLTAMDGHDAVVHFAAETHVDRSIKDGYSFVRTNCFGTNVLCDVARRVGVRRFLHISTDEVYGSIEHGSFSETDVLSPRSPYSAAKAGSDLIALSYHTTHGLPVLVTRCSNNFGPYQFPEKVIPLFTTNLLDGRNVPLYGDGGNIRDWIHVHDHNTAADLVLRSGNVGEVYNIGAGNEITNRELTHRLLELTGRDESFITPVEDRLGFESLGDEQAEGNVVVVALGDGLLENGGIGRHADHAGVANERIEFTGNQRAAADEVQPDTLAEREDLFSTRGHERASSRAARDEGKSGMVPQNGDGSVQCAPWGGAIATVVRPERRLCRKPSSWGTALEPPCGLAYD